MARDGDGLFRRAGIWYFKYKDPAGVYREKSTGKRKQLDAREYKHQFLEASCGGHHLSPSIYHPNL